MVVLFWGFFFVTKNFITKPFRRGMLSKYTINGTQDVVTIRKVEQVLEVWKHTNFSTLPICPITGNEAREGKHISWTPQSQKPPVSLPEKKSRRKSPLCNRPRLMSKAMTYMISSLSSGDGSVRVLVTHVWGPHLNLQHSWKSQGWCHVLLSSGKADFSEVHWPASLA